MKKLISILVIVMILVTSLVYAMDFEVAKTYVGKKVSLLADYGLFGGDRSIVGEVLDVKAIKENEDFKYHYMFLREKDSLKIIRVFTDSIVIIDEVEY